MTSNETPAERMRRRRRMFERTATEWIYLAPGCSIGLVAGSEKVARMKAMTKEEKRALAGAYADSIFGPVKPKDRIRGVWGVTCMA